MDVKGRLMKNSCVTPLVCPLNNKFILSFLIGNDFYIQLERIDKLLNNLFSNRIVLYHRVAFFEMFSLYRRSFARIFIRYNRPDKITFNGLEWKSLKNYNPRNHGNLLVTLRRLTTHRIMLLHFSYYTQLIPSI